MPAKSKFKIIYSLQHVHCLHITRELPCPPWQEWLMTGATHTSRPARRRSRRGSRKSRHCRRISGVIFHEITARGFSAAAKLNIVSNPESTKCVMRPRPSGVLAGPPKTPAWDPAGPRALSNDRRYRIWSSTGREIECCSRPRRRRCCCRCCGRRSCSS